MCYKYNTLNFLIMLDSIINLVKDEALKAITNNSNVPADKKKRQ